MRISLTLYFVRYGRNARNSSHYRYAMNSRTMLCRIVVDTSYRHITVTRELTDKFVCRRTSSNNQDPDIGVDACIPGKRSLPALLCLAEEKSYSAQQCCRK